MSWTVTLPKEIADDASRLHQHVGACYPDMAVVVTDAVESWIVEAHSQAKTASRFDATLPAELQRRGIGFDDVMESHRIERLGDRIVLESLNHSWALLAWSIWVSEGGSGRPLILHVDSHDDMGTPKVGGSRGGFDFFELVRDRSFDLRQPETMARAILDGAIGIGSFIVPFLAAVPADVVHVVPTPTALAPERHFGVIGGSADGVVDAAGPLVISTELNDSSYRAVVAQDLATVLEQFAEDHRPVFVDIDLDYFAMVDTRPKPNPFRPLSPVRLFDAMASALADVSVFTIATSPGFCPAPHWAGLLDEVHAQIRAAYRRSEMHA